jgi:hypothetical protein
MMATLRSVLALPVEVVADTARLHGLLVQVLDQFVEQARESGWRLEGAPAAVILQPVHAAALGLPVTVPEGLGDFVVAVVSATVEDELDALLAR